MPIRSRLVFLLSCVLSLSAQATEVDCALPSGFDISSIKARVIVLGEGTHGTEQVPAFVAAVLCTYAKANKPVLLAWEQARDKQDVLNEFMDSSGGPLDRKSLVDAVLRDASGQGSLAILEMLDAARRWRQSGHRVAVSMVDTAESDLLLPLYSGEDKYAMFSQGQRQLLMAAAVEARANQYPDHTVIFFTSHASRQVGHPQLGPGYESATLLLSRRMPIHVIGMAYGGGEAWRCQGKTLPEAICKAYEVQARNHYADADQTINLGIVTASPPASPNPDPIYVPPLSAKK